jgi:hypothetical protein
VKQSLGTSALGTQPLLNVGVMPAIAIPELFENIGDRARIPHVWEISTGRIVDDQPEYLTLTEISDTTNGLTKRGIIRLAMPGTRNLAHRVMMCGLCSQPERETFPLALTILKQPLG